MTYDVIYIGSGHAAWHGAQELARAGKKVALIEQEKVSGTCTNFGCNAKILLDGPAELLHHLHNYHGIGINDAVNIVWPELMAYKHQVIDPMDDVMARILAVDGIDIIFGHASFVDEHTVVVADETYTADNFVLAMGQRAAKLPVAGTELTYDSKDFLDLPEMPTSMILIGAGFIGMEFASIAHTAGSDVTIIEYADRALANFDAEYTQRVVEIMSEKGINFAFGNAVNEIKATDNGYIVTTAQGNQFEAAMVFDTTGRIPNIDHMNLEDIGVETNRGGVVVNDYMQTSVSRIYASGDVVAKTTPRLTPTATFESLYIADILLGKENEAIKYPAVPTVTFTLPRMAQIGVSTTEANASDEYQVHNINFAQLGMFASHHDQEAKVKIVLNRDKQLVGAAIIGDAAPELVNTLVPIINHKYTKDDLNKTIYAFPTASAMLPMLLANFLA